jgi:hypothetical protein
MGPAGGNLVLLQEMAVRAEQIPRSLPHYGDSVLPDSIGICLDVACR